jgi:hypothetical protein
MPLMKLGDHRARGGGPYGPEPGQPGASLTGCVPRVQVKRSGSGWPRLAASQQTFFFLVVRSPGADLKSRLCGRAPVGGESYLNLLTCSRLQQKPRARLYTGDLLAVFPVTW